MSNPLSFARPDAGIRWAQDLIRRIESNPASAAQIVGMDRWARWMLGHGMEALVAAGLDEWEIAALECIVRHSGEEKGIPQAWLFEGGPDDDPRLRELSCLKANARKTRITRLVSRFARLRSDLNLTWKVERAADCSKTIYTAHTAAYAFSMPQPPDGR
jgi:hypothetical protein